MGCSHLIVIGASTGGVRVVTSILQGLPALRAAVLLVQHMPRFINDSFRRSMAAIWRGETVMADDGVHLRDGCLFIAPSERHCLISNGRLRLEDSPPVHFVRPSIDVTMTSIRAPLTTPLTAVLLSGMGRDGAAGLHWLRQLGAITIVQDAESCAVYGMPAEAVRLGAAQYQLTPREIAAWLAGPACRLSPSVAR